MDVVLQYKSVLLSGTLTTTALALSSLVMAVLLGLAGALSKLSSSRVARTLASFYTTLIRGIPDLVLMLLLFYGGQQALNSLGLMTGWWEYVEISRFTAGTLAIGVISGAYLTETFRGAIMAIPVGQIEAGVAFGMNRWQVLKCVIAPQMVRHALPGFSNNWLVQLKATALVSVIGLQDLVYSALVAGRSTGNVFSFMFAVLVIYLAMTAISDASLRWIGRKFNRGVVQVPC